MFVGAGSEKSGVGVAPARLAIVDHEVLVAQALAFVLDREPDVEVVGTAATAEAGLRLIARTAPHVVLMAYRLPDVDGPSTARAVIRSNPAIKVLMLVESASTESLSKTIDAGCSALLEKHRPVSEVMRAIRAARRGESIVTTKGLQQLVATGLAPCSGRIGKLTERERTVLVLLARAESIASISECLHLSRNTVRNHVQNILTKLGVHSQLEAVTVAIREGAVSPADVGSRWAAAL